MWATRANAPTYAASTPAVQRVCGRMRAPGARAHRVSNPPQPPARARAPCAPSPSSAMTNGVAWCAKRRQSMASLWESMAANRAVAMPHSLRTLTPRESCPSVPIRLRRSWAISMSSGRRLSIPNDRSSASTWDLATSCPRNLPPSIYSAISRPMSASATLARAVLAVKGKYGKNALVKGLSFTAGATARERNEQVGGHRA